MTVVTAELVFARDRWERRHAFVLQGGGILDTGDPREMAALFYTLHLRAMDPKVPFAVMKKPEYIDPKPYLQ